MSEFTNTVDLLGDSTVLNSIISRTITEFYDNRVTKIGTQAFRVCGELVTIDLPNVTSISTYSFRDCISLTSVNLPAVTSIGAYGFYGCSALEFVSLPLLTNISSSAFAYCYNLQKIDLPVVTAINTYGFSYCHSLTALILRSTSMCTLSNVNGLNRCYHITGATDDNYNPNGDKDGYIYVPSSLVDTYKADSAWSNYSTQFRAIEDYPDICG